MCVIHAEATGVHNNVRSRVYHKALEPKQSIRRDIAAIPADVLHQVMTEVINRAKECSIRAGDRLRDVIFKA